MWKSPFLPRSCRIEMIIEDSKECRGKKNVGEKQITQKSISHRGLANISTTINSSTSKATD